MCCKNVSMNIKINRYLLLFVISYLVILHGFVFVALWKSNIIPLFKARLGYLPPEITQHYKRMLSFHVMADGSLSEKSVVFVGDSIVQGLCVSCVTNNAINYGIGMDTTLGVINRINQYKSLNVIKAVVIAVGFNDLSIRTNDEILQNYEKIILKIPRQLELIFSAVLPVDSKYLINNQISNTRIRELNSGLSSLCNSYGNCFYLNSCDKMIDSSGNLRRELHIGDGIHLSTDAYAIWINDLKHGLSLSNH